MVTVLCVYSIPSLTEDQAGQAFKTFASAHCCYSGGPANDGVITNMESLNTYRVTHTHTLRLCLHFSVSLSALNTQFLFFKKQ